MLGARDTGRIKIILILSTEVVAIHIEATIVQVGVFGLDGPIPKCKV